MYFSDNIRQAIGNGLRSIAGAAACLQEMLFYAMSIKILSSTIAPSHFRREMTAADENAFGYLSSLAVAMMLSVMLMLPATSHAVIINNTVTVNNNFGPLTASTDVVSIFNTPSTIELLQYTPVSVAGSSIVSVPTTSYSTTGLPAGPFAASSNPVAIDTTPITILGGLDFLQATSYKSGEPVFIRVTDADQNINPLTSDTVVVTVTTSSSGDSVILQLTETGPSTGVFVGYIQSSNAAVAVNDDVISVGTNETLTVSYVDAFDGTDTSATGVLVDPFGMLFSTADGSPVNGASVTMIDVATGLPATIFGDDGVSIFPATVTSGGVATDSGGNTYNFPPGNYRFPFVSPGSYRLDVIPPAGFNAPSTIPTATIQALPGAPFSIVTGSRSENFIVNPGPALHIDYPLDASPSGLFITKQAMKNSVAIGEFLQYKLDVSNAGAIALNGTSIVDVLPVGFRYEPGSTRIDAVTAPDPLVSPDGQTLTFIIGALTASSAIDLRYVAAVTPGAKEGNAVNVASGTANGGVTSNMASASVLVVDDMMDSRSHLLGRVIAGGCDAAFGESGAVSLQLQSQIAKDSIDYTATLNVEVVAVNNLFVVVNLPGALEYVNGSAKQNGARIADPVVSGSQLRFRLGEAQQGTSSSMTFSTRTRANAFGEFSIRAYAEFDDPAAIKRQQPGILRTPVAINKLKDFSRIFRLRFGSLSATLKPEDLQDIDEFVTSLEELSIRRILVVGHADKQPIRARSRSIFASNEALSLARAGSVSKYLQKTLNDKNIKIDILGMGANKQLQYSDRILPEQSSAGNQLLLNRRVEVQVELDHQFSNSRFIVSQHDSGAHSVKTTGPRGKLSEPGLAGDIPGVQNIRLYLEDGRFVDTDENGMYHFEGLRPGTHVVQLDLASVPDGMEVFSCEKNTRFAGTPHSQFVDMQGGTLWRADFYLRYKPTAANTGNVGIQLTSDLIQTTGDMKNSNVQYRAKLTGKGVTMLNRRLVVDLPDGAQYVPLSALFNNKPASVETNDNNQLIIKLGDSDTQTWQNDLTFNIDQVKLSEGEFNAIAVLLFETANGRSHQSSIVENILVSKTESLRKLIFLGHYQGQKTRLPQQEIKRLEGAIDYMRGKKIRLIEVIARTIMNPADAQQEKIRPENKTLAEARANKLGTYIARSLGLHNKQVKRTGVVSEQTNEKNTTLTDPSVQLVEILVTLSDKQAQQKIHIGQSDSGLLTSAVVGATPTVKNNKVKPLTVYSNQDGIQDIIEQQRIGHRIMPVRALLDSRLKPVLKIDGKTVDEDRIAMIIPDKETGKTLYSYIGVDLGKAGKHVLSFTGIGPFGNARFKQNINIVRTGEVRDIRVIETSGNIADGKSPVRVELQLLDKAGETIHTQTNLKIESGDLRPYDDKDLLPELRRNTDIINVDADGYVQFAPVTSSGIYNITLSYNERSVDIPIYIKPHYREWIMVGLAEGTLGHKNLSGNMQNLEAADIDDNYFQDGRLAFFAKGKIKGEYLLTVSFDSERETPEQGNGLFGTIDPSKYYTLYGDTTTVRYDAPSTEKLYLRIESDNFYAMFGDYNTDLSVTELGRYNRSLTGLKTEYQDGNISVTAFATQTEQAFTKDELRGDGTSGLYRLSRQNIVLNSEKITIEVRDRFQSQNVLESQQLRRYIDYTFDPVDGTFYFREPIYNRDENFNPIYIVVDYEVAAGGDESLTAGGRIAFRPSDSGTELGATIIHEGTPGAEADLLAADATYNLNSNTTLKAEIATTRRESSTGKTEGSAFIAEALTRTNKLDSTVYIRRQDGEFGLGQQQGSETGTQKIGAGGRYQLRKDTGINAEVFRHENLGTDATRDVVETSVDFKHNKSDFSAGLRFARDEDKAGGTNESTLLIGSARRAFMNDRLNLNASADIALDNADNPDYPNRLIFGADYQLRANTQLFAAQEFTFGTNQDSTTTRVGLKASPWRNATLTTSIEGQHGEYGPRVFSNMGLTQGVQINRFLSVDFGIEKVKTLRDPGDVPFNVNVPPASGTVSDDFTAVTIGANYIRQDWSFTSRGEWRDGEQEDKRGLLIGFYRKHAPGLGLASSLRHFDTERSNGTENITTSLNFSLAYRPLASQWIILDRVQYANESEHMANGTTRTRKLINNLNANYLYDRNNQVSLMHGIKYVIDNFDGIEYSGMTNLFGIEYRHNLGHRWDIGTQASIRMSDVGDSHRYSYGVSIGHTLAKNLWLSIGYNVEGFSDDDFSLANYTASGVFAKIRFSFDHLTARQTMAWWEKRKQ